jgi:hypothetical protein
MPLEATTPIFLGEFDEMQPIDATPERAAQFVGRMEELSALREALASSTTVVVRSLHGTGAIGKTQLATEYVRAHRSDWSNSPSPIYPQNARHVFGPSAADWWTNSAAATLTDKTMPALAALMESVRPSQLSSTLAETVYQYRSAPQWLYISGLSSAEEHATAIASTASTPRPKNSGWPIQRWTDWLSADRAAAIAEHCDLRFVTLFVRLDPQHQLREGLLQLIDGILTALCLALILCLAAFAYCPNVRSFVLVLVATARHYGHRSEPDDCSLPTHPWMSAIGGEPALNC